MRKAIVSCGFVLALCAAARAQDAPAPGMLLMESDPEQGRGGGQGGGAPPSRISVGIKLEYWEAEMEVTHATSGQEQGVEFEALHAAGLLVGDYGFQSGQEYMFNVHVGAGWEQLGTRLVLDSTNLFGPADFDVIYEEAGVVYEFGGGLAYVFDKNFIRVDVLYRRGEAERGYNDAPSFLVEYEYTMMRFTGKIGMQASQFARPYVGVRYTKYEAEYTETAGGVATSWEFEFEQPYGFSVGVEMDAGPVTGFIEIMLVDTMDTGFMASLGHRF